MDVYQFGKLQFDINNRQIIEANQTKTIRRKVAAVLQLLLENRHRVVTREELLNSVWSNGTYRENSLLSCISELRKIFSDNIKSPVFIKTYHLNGYQWIYQPTSLIHKKPPLEDYDISRPPDIENVSVDFASVHTKITAISWKKRVATFQFGLGFSIIIATAVAMFNFDIANSHSEVPIGQHIDITHTKKIILLPFVNNTGNEKLKWVELGLSDMMAENLSRLPEINVIPNHVVQSKVFTLQESDATEYRQYQNDILRDFQADYIVHTSISKSNKTFKIQIKLYSKDKEIVLDKYEFQDLFIAMSTLTEKIASTLLPNTIDISIKLAYSGNKQANEDYARGLQALHTKGPKLAKHYFQAALINDSEFMWAKAYLALVLNRVGEFSQSKKLFSELIDQNNPLMKPRLAAFVHLGIAQTAFMLENIPRAESHLKLVIDIAQKSDDKYTESEAFWRLSAIRERQARWVEQGRLQNRALMLTQYFDNSHIHADNLYYLGSPSNSRLETNPSLDVKLNRINLEHALNYYIRVENKSGIANSRLAMAKNYDFEFDERIKFLQQAIQIYNETGEKIQLVNALMYKGYLYIQYRKGLQAIDSIEKSLKLTQALGAVKLTLRGNFLLAFAHLDQGINGNQIDREKKLSFADRKFREVIQTSKMLSLDTMLAPASILLGWTLSEKGLHQGAITIMLQGKTLYNKLGLYVSEAYCVMSIVREYIELNQWEKALSYRFEKNLNKRTKLYLARAHYELREYQSAYQMAKKAKNQFFNSWNNLDEKRMELYLNVNKFNLHTLLPPEQSAHTQYCEEIT